MLPVVKSLSALPGARQNILFTGQHKGLEADFVLPGVSLSRHPSLPSDLSSRSLRRHFRQFLGSALLRTKPDLVLVHGDTTSAVAGALAARDQGLPLGHVEAGLRSHNLRQPYPEEGNRVIIDRLSTLLFAPTRGAAGNLGREKRVSGRVFVTGNTGIDAVLAAKESLGRLRPPEQRTILVTCHRKENQGGNLRDICEALKAIVSTLSVEVVFPLHCNPAIRQPIVRSLSRVPGIRLIDPVAHGEMVRLMLEAWLILTDSGGLQEEGAALGRPVFVLRNVTERSEGVRLANIRLIGTQTDAVVNAVAALDRDPQLYRNMAVPSYAFGDGRAAPRIAAEIAKWLAGRRGTAPFSLHAPADFAKDWSHGAIMAPRELERI